MEKKYFYIKKNNKQHIVDFSEELITDNLGETYEDYEENKWVLLSDEQVAFYEQHPDASPKEVWDMALNEKTLEQVKQEKLWEIDSYDHSNAVESFTIGGQQMWLTRDERTQIDESINAYEATGATEMTKYFGGVSYTFTLTLWKQMLNALIVYASEALNVTEAHMATVQALETIEEVEEYDITAGYPEKLVFSV